jgi:hypothetical protein
MKQVRDDFADFLKGTNVTTWADEYLTQIEDCEKREGRLNDWERGFIDSLRRQIEGGRRPTPPQIETLDRIWEAATKRG